MITLDGIWRKDNGHEMGEFKTQELGVVQALVRLCVFELGMGGCAEPYYPLEILIHTPILDRTDSLKFTGPEAELAVLHKALALFKMLQSMPPSQRRKEAMGLLPGCKSELVVFRALGCGPGLHEPALGLLALCSVIRGDRLTKEDLEVATDLRRHGRDDFESVMELTYETGQAFKVVAEGVKPSYSFNQVVGGTF